MSKKRQYLIDMSAEQLVDHLLEQWPARCIGPTDTEVQAHRYAGKRELIENLRTRINREKEKYGSTTQNTL